MKTFKQFILLTEGNKIKPDPTKFEGDLLGAMGSSSPGSANAKWPAPLNSTEPVVLLARGIVKKMKAGRVNLTDPERVSGDSPKSNLTPLYIKWGAENGEPKTDICFGGKNVSVKKSKSSFIFTAQGPEAAAIIQASVKHYPQVRANAEELAKKAGEIVKELLAADKFYTYRGGATKAMIAQALRDNKVDKEADLPDEVKDIIKAHKKKLGAANKSLTNMIGIGSKPSKNETVHFVTIAKELGILKKIYDAIPGFLGEESTKLGIFKEGATGKYKFNDPKHIATHMLAWGDDPSKPAYALKTANAFVKQVISSMKYTYSVRDRGGISSDRINKMLDGGLVNWAIDLNKIDQKGRGGQLNLSIKEHPVESCMVDLNDGEREFITEMADELGEIHRTYLTENIEQVEMLLIQEGMFDKLVDLKKAAKTKISDYVNKVKNAVTVIVDKLKTWIKSVGEWIMKLAKNPGVFMTMFKIDPTIKFSGKWISV